MSVNHPNPPGLRREQPIQKAARLLREGRVSASRGARVYTVTGDTGIYRVIAEHDGIHCPCPARTPLCAHVLAVAQCVSSERGPVEPVPEPERDPFAIFDRLAALQALGAL
jgi:hypothetical protein